AYLEILLFHAFVTFTDTSPPTGSKTDWGSTVRGMERCSLLKTGVFTFDDLGPKSILSAQNVEYMILKEFWAKGNVGGDVSGDLMPSILCLNTLYRMDWIDTL
ncbi:unnamed protein product, partial [Owenia fusiformis]